MRTVLVVLALLASGCSLGEQAPTGQQFLLRGDDTSANLPPRGATSGTLTVQAARVAAPFGQRAFIYRHADDAYEADPYNGFLAAPSAMITDATILWLRQHGPFANVVGEGIVLDARYRLQQFVVALYAEFVPGTSRAVVQTQYVLTDDSASPSTVLLNEVFTGTAPLADGKPATVAAGMNAALRQALEKAGAQIAAAVK